VFFHCKLLHRANANKSDEAKISFVYTLKGASNSAILGTRSCEFREIRLN
jgi:phytanoyl-CoA hydroxylase